MKHIRNFCIIARPIRPASGPEIMQTEIGNGEFTTSLYEVWDEDED